MELSHRIRSSMSVLAGLVLLASCCGVKGRSWTETDTIHSLASVDDSGLVYLLSEQESLLVSSAEYEELVENRRPLVRSPTTNQPSPMPSATPSVQPSTSPSAHPTATPTATPTVDPFKAADEPRDPTDWYFNYNPDSRHGPDRWSNVEVTDNNYYWDEFGSSGFGAWKNTLGEHDLDRNVCDSGRKQSPIDLHHRRGAICHDFHEVRSLRGDFSVSGQNAQRQIKPNKLRVKYNRRPCADVLNNERCREPDPPRADFPNGWPGMADVLHIDLKIPSEHIVRGERFDAEMQIFHLHAANHRVPTQAVLIRAEAGGYNYYFQEALNAFARQYDENRSNCRRRMQQGEHDILLSEDDDAAFSTAMNRTLFAGHRNLQTFPGGAWDPHHAMLIPTIHFYRYEGSLTEPPCTEFVTWFVADKPMIISHEQLELMRVLLFTNVHAHNCKLSGVHRNAEDGVARPIQPLHDRGVYQCTPDDFGPDP